MTQTRTCPLPQLHLEVVYLVHDDVLESCLVWQWRQIIPEKLSLFLPMLALRSGDAGFALLEKCPRVDVGSTGELRARESFTDHLVRANDHAWTGAQEDAEDVAVTLRQTLEAFAQVTDIQEGDVAD